MAWWVLLFGSTGTLPASRRLFVPLPKSIQEIADRVIAFYDRPVGDGPYQVYQYLPQVEYRVRRDLGDLQTYLRAKGIECVAISLADVMWQAVEDSGRLEAIIGAERNGARLAEVAESVGGLLKRSPTLADRIVERVEEAPPRTAVFLYRAGALYPALRTSGLLDELLGRVRLPVTMLYPGRLHGSHGLSFMDALPPHYGYRAVIVPRGENE
jgi:hypothetical protein